MDREKLSCHWLTITGKRKPWTTDKQQTKDIWAFKHLVVYFPGFKVFQDSFPPFSATQLSLGWKPLTEDWISGTVGWIGPINSSLSQPIFHSPLVLVVTMMSGFGLTAVSAPMGEQSHTEKPRWRLYSKVPLSAPAEVPSWCESDVMAPASSPCSTFTCFWFLLLQLTETKGT